MSLFDDILTTDSVIKEIKTFIHLHLPIKQKLKKEYAEVFTCYEMICKMLDKLPNNVWNNPELKWLEPSCGVGGFMAVVYCRLMNGLHDWCPNIVVRSEHILRNMLFMVDLNNENIDICRKFFLKIHLSVSNNSIDSTTDSTTDSTVSNIICADFLLWETEKRYNIILGNLPFQSKSCKGGKNKLYEKMMNRCLDLFTDYILVITPDNIFSGGSKIYERILAETHVNMIDFAKSNQDFFPEIQIYICYFLLEREVGKSNTNIICNDGSKMEMRLLNRVINPVRDWNPATEQLVEKYIGTNKNNVVYCRGQNVSSYIYEYGVPTYSLIYTPKQNLYTSHESLATGRGIPKIVVFSISVNLEFKEDFEGYYGSGPNTFYIPVKDAAEGAKIAAFLKSHDYRVLALATKTNRQFLKSALLQYLKLEDLIV